MSRMRTRRTWLCLVCSLAMGAGAARADLLTDGGFESAAIVPDWNLVESIYDQTTMTDRDFGDINTAMQQVFGPHSGPLALWLRAFVGGSTPGPNNLTNAILSQTAPAVVGEQYTFTGWSRFESNYSGGYETLPITSPLGEVPSPTTTSMKLEFLDSGGSIVGSPVVLDVEAERKVRSGINFPNDNIWYQHTLVSTAPTGAANVRVTADARKMVATEGNPDGGFYDDLELRTANAPGNQLLANPSLDIRPDPIGPAWEVTQVPGGQFPLQPTVSTGDFASRPDGVGQLGAWLRAFTGSAGQPADAILEQTVAGVPLGEYEFSGWSRFEPNYTGGLAGFSTQTLFEMEFLDAEEELIPDSIVTLDLKVDGQANGAGWRQHFLSATAPEDTVSVRVRAAGLDMVNNPSGGQQSAFLDDFMLTLESPPQLVGDYNDDGKVDTADYVTWRKNENTNNTLPNDPVGPPIDHDQYNNWRANFGEMSGSSSAAPVPEPSVYSLALISLLAAAGARRNSRCLG